MNANDIIKRAQEEFARLGKIPGAGVVGLLKTEDRWIVSLEALERRAIPDTMDVLGLYEIYLNSEGSFLGFERKKLRKRGETGQE